MVRVICVLFIMLVCISSRAAFAESSDPRVQLKTNYGKIVLELDAQAAPKTVENFLNYVREGFYDDTIFHRVIKGFMIQGGGLTEDMNKKATQESVMNEADNGLKNLRGTIAMARTSDPHSATGQFFINTVDNAFLDFKAKTSQGWGYCVFGKVVEGMAVVDKIETLPTTSKSGHGDVPTETVQIESAAVVEE